ncbi:MAG: deoxyhypusine synthase [Candidatus Bathyarchaeia archaeon]
MVSKALKRSPFLRTEVRDMKLWEGMRIQELVRQMGFSGGFSAKSVAKGVEILTEMFRDEDCKIFLSFPACIVATGLRGALADLVRRGFVDAIITAGGTFDHDLARAWGGSYYHGSFYADDVELHKVDIHRLGNIFIPMENYGILLEAKMKPVLEEIAKGGARLSVRELAMEFGSRLEDPNSILFQAARAKVPIYSLGILDSAFGSQLFFFAQTRDFQVDFWKDMKELIELVMEAKKTGAIIIGGGISKHTLIWFNQFRGGLDMAVSITTAVEYDGSLSGARLREAISWGKVKEGAKEVTIDGEATVLLPLMLTAAYEGLKETRSKEKMNENERMDV